MTERHKTERDKTERDDLEFTTWTVFTVMDGQQRPTSQNTGSLFLNQRYAYGF
jgi:hypothetical protein